MPLQHLPCLIILRRAVVAAVQHERGSGPRGFRHLYAGRDGVEVEGGRPAGDQEQIHGAGHNVHSGRRVGRRADEASVTSSCLAFCRTSPSIEGMARCTTGGLLFRAWPQAVAEP